MSEFKTDLYLSPDDMVENMEYEKSLFVNNRKISVYDNEINVVVSNFNLAFGNKKALEAKKMHKKLGTKSKNHENSALSSMYRAKRKIRSISKLNKFTHFITLTFNSTVDFYDIVQVKDKIRRYLDKLVSDGSGYIGVFEKHQESGGFHFHLLVTNYNLENTVNIRCGRGKWALNDKRWVPNGYSYVEELYSDISFYLVKYITKDSNFYGRWYYSSNNILKTPDVFYDSVNIHELKLTSRPFKLGEYNLMSSEWFDIIK